MLGCEQFRENSRRRAICEGTVDLPLSKVNAFRESYGLQSLEALKETKPFAITVHENAQKTTTRKIHASAPCPTCAKPKAIKEGPGTELKAIFRAADVPPCQLCDAAAQRMNELGPDGCLAEIDSLAQEMLPRALAWIKANKPWVHALLPSVVEELGAMLRLKGYIRQAVSAYQGKQNQLTAGSSI